MDPKETEDPHKILQKVSAQTADKISCPGFPHLLPAATPHGAGSSLLLSTPLKGPLPAPYQELEYQRLNCLDI